MRVKPVLLMSGTKSIKKNIVFCLYQVKINENTYHISHLTSAFSDSRIENMKSQLVMVVCHIFTAISHYSYRVLSSQLFFKDPSVFLLYSQRVTRARSFESILFQAI